jgi:hypothetical protein
VRGSIVTLLVGATLVACGGKTSGSPARPSTDAGAAITDAAVGNDATTGADADGDAGSPQGPEDAGADAPQCSSPHTACAGTCVDLRSDENNCGACGATCNGGLVCKQGMCALECANGTTLCGGGTCVDTQTDSQNCGACDRPCASGQVCSQGACVSGCTSGEMCNGTCVNTQQDPNNCGACGVVCPCKPTPGCHGGACTCSCAAGLVECVSNDGGPGECADVQTSTFDCGQCGNVCPAGEMCAGGHCGCWCVGGTACVDGGCPALDASAD